MHYQPAVLTKQSLVNNAEERTSAHLAIGELRNSVQQKVMPIGFERVELEMKLRLVLVSNQLMIVRVLLGFEQELVSRLQYSRVVVGVADSDRVQLVDVQAEQFGPVYVVGGEDLGVAVQVDYGQPLFDEVYGPVFDRVQIGAGYGFERGVGCLGRAFACGVCEYLAFGVDADGAGCAAEADVALAPDVVAAVGAQDWLVEEAYLK